MVMVIKIEYGNQDDIAIRSSIQRNINKNQLIAMSEGFFQQQYLYRWGKMYTISGKEEKLFRQF